MRSAHHSCGPQPRRETTPGADAAPYGRHSSELDELDVESILAFAERILPRTADLWVQASLDQRQRFQQLLFPAGIAFDGNGYIRTAVTAPAFNTCRRLRMGKKGWWTSPAPVGTAFSGGCDASTVFSAWSPQPSDAHMLSAPSPPERIADHAAGGLESPACKTHAYRHARNTHRQLAAPHQATHRPRRERQRPDDQRVRAHGDSSEALAGRVDGGAPPGGPAREGQGGFHRRVRAHFERLVFDTNVAVAGIVAEGRCRETLEIHLPRARCDLSQVLWDELVATLRRKFGLTPDDLPILALYRQHSTWCEPAALADPVCRDPDDDWVLATAAAGEAEAIVSGHADLLSLSSDAGIEMLLPRQFVSRQMPRPRR